MRKVMPIELCGHVGACMSNPESYKSQCGNFATSKRVAEESLPWPHWMIRFEAWLWGWVYVRSMAFWFRLRGGAAR